jgi:ATP-dependent DNA helicase RecG
MTVQLDSALTALAGVGPALANKLERLNLYRVEDLLFLLPLRYEDRTQLVRLGALVAGERCLVTGEVLLAETTFRGRRNLLVRIGDGSGQLTLRFFHFSRSQQAQFQPGVRITCFGEARKGRAGLEMIHPEYRLLRAEQDPAINESLTPIYPATEGVQQGRLRNLTGQALDAMRGPPPVPTAAGLRGAARPLPEPQESAGTRRHGIGAGAQRRAGAGERIHRQAAVSADGCATARH